MASMSNFFNIFMTKNKKFCKIHHNLMQKNLFSQQIIVYLPALFY